MSFGTKNRQAKWDLIPNDIDVCSVAVVVVFLWRLAVTYLLAFFSVCSACTSFFHALLFSPHTLSLSPPSFPLSSFLPALQILITHMPPHGILDFAMSGSHWGCKDLLQTVTERVKPKYHFFGHVHEGTYERKMNKSK